MYVLRKCSWQKAAGSWQSEQCRYYHPFHIHAFHFKYFFFWACAALNSFHLFKLWCGTGLSLLASARLRVQWLKQVVPSLTRLSYQ
jgi:hypothetical protein